MTFDEWFTTTGYKLNIRVDILRRIWDTARTGTRKAVDIAKENGTTNGGHHKMWVIDQMVRSLLGEDGYTTMVENMRTNGYNWNEGVAP